MRCGRIDVIHFYSIDMFAVASGKSTVGRILGKAGYVVVNSEKIKTLVLRREKDPKVTNKVA